MTNLYRLNFFYYTAIPGMSVYKPNDAYQIGFSEVGEVFGNGIFDGLRDTAKTLWYGQFQLPPPERKVMEELGNQKIVSISVYRAPIKVIPLDGMLNLITRGRYGELLKKYNYDTLFHLYMICTLENSQRVVLEKNERINIERSFKEGGERVLAKTRDGLTLNRLVQQTAKFMGKDFFPYHPATNNCQRFLTAILKSNGLLTLELNEFINQDVTQLLDELDPSGLLVNAANNAVRVGTFKDIVVSGGGLN